MISGIGYWGTLLKTELQVLLRYVGRETLTAKLGITRHLGSVYDPTNKTIGSGKVRMVLTVFCYYYLMVILNPLP